MCPYITDFHTVYIYKYVGVIGVGDRGKKRPETKIVFSFFFLFGNRKTAFKKSLFGRENRKVKRPTKTIFGFRFTTLSIAVYVQIYSQHVSVSSYIMALLQLAT